MCVMNPSAGTGAGGLHVELCVPNENHGAYSVLMMNSYQFWIPTYTGYQSMLDTNNSGYLPVPMLETNQFWMPAYTGYLEYARYLPMVDTELCWIPIHTLYQYLSMLDTYPCGILT
jgi:hypothetical protein